MSGMAQSSYKSYLNLGDRTVLGHVAKSLVRNDGRHRWRRTAYANTQFVAWMNNDDIYTRSRLFIVQSGKQFVVGRARMEPGDELMIEVKSGPFPILRAAKVAYLMEDHNADE